MKRISAMLRVAALGWALCGWAPAAEPAPQAAKALKFDFGPGAVAPGYVQVLPETLYAKDRGYGFEAGAKVQAFDRGGTDPLRADGCYGEAPFLFSVALPEGNYNVTVTLGDPKEASETTLKAEQRRLMLEDVKTAPGAFERRTVTISVRRPEIAGGGRIKLKPRELSYPNWDEKLTLEFNGKRPSVCALEIAPAPEAVTVLLAGDSTVTDQDKEPWNSWGQMLTRFFKPGVAVANYAESGESLRSFIGERRMDKVLSVARPGDYLFIQMGHNDQKDKSPDKMEVYRRNLKRFVEEARKRGATPVLVTSMNRRRFDADGKVINTLQEYTDAVREVAREERTALIDLNAMSKRFYEALGAEGSQAAFQDGTHHNNYGSYELAKCIAQGIRENKLDLAKFIVDDFKGFDPGRPDPVSGFDVPPSPMRSSEKPEGN